MIAFVEFTAFPFRLLLPEVLLAAALLAVLLPNVVPALRGSRVALWLAILAAAGAFTATLFPVLGNVAEHVPIPPPGPGELGDVPRLDANENLLPSRTTRDGAVMLQVDHLAALARSVIAFVLLLLLLVRTTDRDDAEDTDAWSACTLSVGLGALLVASSANVLPLWLGLELISLGSYALAAWRGGDRRAAEAGMKYVLFGGAATGLMLFGISHLYGITGHFDFAGIGSALGANASFAAIAALCFAGIGIAYKLTLVPFHVYAPDVYQGGPPTSVAIVATLPKLAAGAVLLRALGTALPGSLLQNGAAGHALALVAIASLALGALLSVVQTDARRIVAFSGIGHGGTAVLAAAAMPGPAAIAATLLHLAAYAISAFGALACLAVLERDRRSTDLAALPGAMRRHPWVTVALCLFLASLAGIPPIAGFLSKWAVLDVAMRSGPTLFVAAMTLLATTAVFAWAYLKIVRAAVLQPERNADPTAAADRTPAPTTLALAVAAAVVIGLGLWLDVLHELRTAIAG